MKRLYDILTAAAAVFALAACQEEVEPILDVDSTTMEVSFRGGEYSVGIEANSDWTATTEVSWLKMSNPKGNGDATLNMSATANNTPQIRKAVVTVTSGSIVKKISVTQELGEGMLEVQKNSYHFEYTGGSASMDLYSTGDWKVTSDVTWIKVAPSTGTAEGQETKITVEANPKVSERTGILTISNENQKKTVTVTQDALPADLTLNKEALSFGEAGGSSAIALTSNISWTSSTSASWLTVSPASGKEGDNQAVTISAKVNDGAAREGTVTFAYADVNKTVKVSQDGLTPVLTLSKTSGSVEATGGKVDFTLSTNVSWSASCSEDWITITPASGKSGDNQGISISAAENDGDQRSAVITFTGNTLTQKFTLTQAKAKVVEYLVIDLAFTDGTARTWPFTSKGYGTSTSTDSKKGPKSQDQKWTTTNGGYEFHFWGTDFLVSNSTQGMIIGLDPAQDYIKFPVIPGKRLVKFTVKTASAGTSGDKLQVVDFSDNKKYIGEGADQGTDKITEINLPGTVADHQYGLIHELSGQMKIKAFTLTYE